MNIFRCEIKMNRKQLLIWSVCAGFTCFGCLLLFDGLKDTMGQMEQAYSQMGAFSAALGLDKVSIAQIDGFYAAEVALVFSVGGAMFAAMTGAVMLSKEEEGHTAEFLYSLPAGRTRIVLEKYMAVCSLLLLFHVLCILWEMAGFILAGELPPAEKYISYHVLQLLMGVEIGSVCFCISSVCRKKQIGAAIGLSVFLYMMDILCRVIPDLDSLKYITPYYYSNAADIFAGVKIDMGVIGIHGAVTILAAITAAAVNRKKDLSA